MSPQKSSLLRWSMPALVLLAAACQDMPAPTDVDDAPEPPETIAPQQMRAMAARSVPEVLALPQTVFGGYDEASNQLVFGVENRGVMRGVRNVMERRGVPSSAYRMQVVEPIHFAATLRDRHRPTMGGLQIHFSNYVCTLGFSAAHAEGYSFITNSHCTDQQGTTGSTTYYQPASSVDSSPIAIEADDPSYFRGGECSRGKKCRYSDASRALYQSDIEGAAEIASTSGANNGSLEVTGSFTIGSQDNTNTTFSGTVNKVGRTTGWTSGTIPSGGSCVTVNVSGSNIQLLCQTMVENPGETVVLGGDSGSPVFRGTGGNVELVGILWGGSGSGDLFVFSPLASVQSELGALDATVGDTGGGGGGGGGGDEPNCPPNSNSPKCRG